MGKMNGSANLRDIAAGDLLVWSVSYGLQQKENWVACNHGSAVEFQGLPGCSMSYLRILPAIFARTLAW